MPDIERSATGARMFRIGRKVPGDAPAIVVLVIHGGPEHGTSRGHRWLPQVLRCRLLARAVVRRWPTRRVGGVVVHLLQNAWTGWDGDGRDAIAAARWALEVLGDRYPGVPIGILGHSMGARVGVRVADDGNVVGVVGLAPWLPAGDPVGPLATRRLCVIQGTRDRELPMSTTTALLSRAGAAGIRVRRRQVRAGGHAMVLRMGTWSRLATDGLVELTDSAHHATRVTHGGDRGASGGLLR